MARSSSSSNTGKYFAGSAAVVVAAFCIGYFVIGGSRHQPTDPENVVPSNIAAPAAPMAKPVVIARTPRTQNGEYTAPGAPRISILEEKNPSLLDTSKQQPKPADDTPKTPDPEASQEAAPVPKTVADTAAPSDTAAPAPDAAPPASDTPSTPPADSAPAPAAAAPSNPDPDTEQVAPRGGEVGQEGTTPKAQFRVQAGSFVASENAKALADALRRRGYVTSTRAERDGDKTVFKVQVGAYRTRSAADKAAQDLQSSGYPASVAPLNP